MEILLEQLTHDNYMDALSINRDDIPEEWVDNASYLMMLGSKGLVRKAFMVSSPISAGQDHLSQA